MLSERFETCGSELISEEADMSENDRFYYQHRAEVETERAQKASRRFVDEGQVSDPRTCAPPFIHWDAAPQVRFESRGEGNGLNMLLKGRLEG